MYDWWISNLLLTNVKANLHWYLSPVTSKLSTQNKRPSCSSLNHYPKPSTSGCVIALSTYIRISALYTVWTPLSFRASYSHWAHSACETTIATGGMSLVCLPLFKLRSISWPSVWSSLCLIGTRKKTRSAPHSLVAISIRSVHTMDGQYRKMSIDWPCIILALFSI